MTSLRALAYADRRAALNDARRVLRSPGRIALWAGYALLLALLVGGRLARAGGSRAHGSLEAGADYFACGLLLTLVFSLAGGLGAIGIFRSRAEARFIIGSPVRAPLAIAYLQARETLRQSARWLFSVVYFAFVFAPRELGLMTALTDAALVIGSVAATAAIVVPRRLLSRRAGVLCAIAGIPLGLLAAAPAVRDIALQVPLPAAVAAPILRSVPAWHPGRILLAPSPGWLLAVAALATLAIAILAAAGRDAYPELYALSIARIERRERRLQRRVHTAAVRSPGRSSLRLPAPAGVLAFVWKSMVEFRRLVSPAYIAGGAVALGVAGFGLARLMRLDSVVFGTLAGIAVNVIVVVGIGATNALAGELRRPLFWLSAAGMFERLLALGIARIWRTVVAFELIALGFAAGGGSPADTLVLAIAFPVLAGLLAGVGFAALALFPSAADQIGPVAALRFAASALLLLPPLVAYAVAAIGFNAPRTALLAGVLLALAETCALVGIAAWRLDGHLDRVPM